MKKKMEMKRNVKIKELQNPTSSKEMEKMESDE
jgi:hypothetical protein